MSEFFYPLKGVFLVKFSVNRDIIDQAEKIARYDEIHLRMQFGVTYLNLFESSLNLHTLLHFNLNLKVAAVQWFMVDITS